MKRSHMIALGAVGLVAGTVYLGQSGKADRSEKSLVYENVADCISANIIGADACEESFRLNREKHVEAAPKFQTQTSCETSYGAGRCQQSQWNGASIFVPALAAVMISRYLSNQSRVAQPLYPGQTGQTGFAPGQPGCPPGATPQTNPNCAPAQRSSSSNSSGFRSSGYSTASGAAIARGNARGETSAARSAVQSPSARSTFGAPSHSSSGASVARGGFGSSASSHSSSSSSS